MRTDLRVQLDRFFLRFPHGVIGLDSDLRVAFANHHARRLLGRDTLRSDETFIDAAEEGSLFPIAEQLVTTGISLPATAVTRPGGRVWRVIGVAAGQDEPAILMIEDVTVQHRQDLVMREFVRNAAHQLRTPLTAIATAIEVLQAGAKSSAADRDRFLDHIDRNTARLSKIARGLLMLARAQSGETLLLGPVELRPQLQLIAEEARPAEGVALLTDCPAALAVLAEPDLMHEALAALVDNAIVHTRAGEIRIEASEAGGLVSVDVTDTGGGIAANDRDRIFEPFYRSSASGDGFGLGLAIASQAVAAMGGEIEAAQAEGGARFTIRLPSAS
jgi:two-component system phosphate regulon sensor histidine kinase PhoR